MNEKEREKQYTEMLKDIVLEEFQNISCSIFLFGSRARGGERRSSDYDIGCSGISRNDMNRIIAKIEFRLEESIIPHKVDWVLFDEAETEFKDIAEKNKVVWKTP